MKECPFCSLSITENVFVTHVTSCATKDEQVSPRVEDEELDSFFRRKRRKHVWYVPRRSRSVTTNFIFSIVPIQRLFLSSPLLQRRIFHFTTEESSHLLFFQRNKFSSFLFRDSDWSSSSSSSSSSRERERELVYLSSMCSVVEVLLSLLEWKSSFVEKRLLSVIHLIVLLCSFDFNLWSTVTREFHVLHHSLRCDRCPEEFPGLRFACLSSIFCEKCEEQVTLEHSLFILSDNSFLISLSQWIIKENKCGNLGFKSESDVYFKK